MSLPYITKTELGVTGYMTRQFMQPGEQNVLLKLVEGVAPRVMIEIGVNIGLTAQAVLRHIATIEHYVGLDVGPHYRFEIAAQQIERPDEPGKLVKHDPRFELVLRDERPIALPRPNVVFIDGDHGREAVRRDTDLATALLLPGGMIIWHDCGNPAVEVTPVLEQLSAEGREIWHVAGTWIAFEHR